MNTTTAPTTDILIIGGGPAGWQAAVTSARFNFRVTVIDSGHPRNQPAAHAHNVFTKEGAAPSELLAAARHDAEGYGVGVLDDAVARLDKNAEGTFVATTAAGSTVSTRRVLLTTGATDTLPAIDGLEKFWGSYVHHCPFCHGYEVRGQRVGIIATSPNAAHTGLLLQQLDCDVTFFAQDPQLIDALTQAADNTGAALRPAISRINGDEELDSVTLVDGSTEELDALFCQPVTHARAELFTALGGQVETTDEGSAIPVDQLQKTSIAGVFAAGNCTNPKLTVLPSAAAGMTAGSMLVADLTGVM